MEKENVMKKIKVEKVTLNIGTGMPGDKLEKATKLLEKISGEKAVSRKTKKRIPTWNVRPGLEIGTKVTIRGMKAKALLKQLLLAKKNRLKPTSFDNLGNFSFGIHEYLDIPKVEYDSSIGIIGLEVAVTLQRPGYRIKHRVFKRKKIPKCHQISKEQAINFMKEEFGIETEVKK